jgi:hypothetical protein
MRSGRHAQQIGAGSASDVNHDVDGYGAGYGPTPRSFVIGPLAAPYTLSRSIATELQRLDVATYAELGDQPRFAAVRAERH